MRAAGPGTRQLRPFLAREWRALAGAGAMSLLLTVAELARPWPLKFVIDKLLSGHDGGFSIMASPYASCTTSRGRRWVQPTRRPTHEW